MLKRVSAYAVVTPMGISKSVLVGFIGPGRRVSIQDMHLHARCGKCRGAFSDPGIGPGLFRGDDDDPVHHEDNCALNIRSRVKDLQPKMAAKPLLRALIALGLEMVGFGRVLSSFFALAMPSGQWGKAV